MICTGHDLDDLRAPLTEIFRHLDEDVPVGDALFRQGDPGDSLYILLRGRLNVSQTDPDTGIEKVLGETSPGESVGEVGLYHGKRTADVKSLTDVRLLRLESDNLRRLRRRYPRIAGQVLWNLSGVMADRLATASDRENRLSVQVNQLSQTPFTNS